MDAAMQAFFGLGFILITIFWFYGPWQTLCVDAARQRIFEARDALFDLASDGEISFQSSEYRELRHSFELLIRFAHRTTWTWLAWQSFFAPLHAGQSTAVAALNRIENPDLRASINRLVLKSAKAIVYMMIARSLLLIVLAALLYLAWATNRKIAQFARICSIALFDNIQNVAEKEDQFLAGGGLKIRQA